MIRLGFTDYIPKGRLERFNKKSIFLKNVREVIREANILKDNNEYTYTKLKKIFPQPKWRYDPFELIRMTILIKPKDYVVIQDILEEHTGHLWEFDIFMNMLIQKFIREYIDKSKKEDNTIVKKFNKRFSKHYGNIMGSWRD